MTYEEKYNHFDVNLLMGKKGEVVSTKEALQDIVPILWEKKQLRGEEQFVLQKKKYKEEV